MSKISLIIPLLILSACSKSIHGVDMSGTYFQSGIQGTNYAKSLNTSKTLTVIGNNYIETATDGYCSTIVEGEVSFDGHTARFTNRHVLNATNGSCEMIIDYTPAGSVYRSNFNSFASLDDKSIDYTLDSTNKRLGIRFATDLSTDLKLVFYRE